MSERGFGHVRHWTPHVLRDSGDDDAGEINGLPPSKSPARSNDNVGWAAAADEALDKGRKEGGRGAMDGDGMAE